MALIRRNTRDLIAPDKLKLKILLYSLHGAGKTKFLSTAKKAGSLGVGVCEVGYGKGLLSAAASELDYVELNNYPDYEVFCSGGEYKEMDSLGLDSLSDASKTFIKDKALSIPRAKGESQKRLLGVPEIDDYGVMGELTRKLTRRLIDQDKHIIVTAGLRIDKPDAETGLGEMLIGPDLPGQMFIGSTAMFDIVLCLRTRSLLRDARDAKSRYTQRYFITENTGGVLAKNRLSVSDEGLSFLPTELLFDLKTGEGTFKWILDKAKEEYTKFLAKKV